MTPVQWDRAQDVFNGLVDMPADLQADEVRRHCSDDALVLETVLKMLHEDRDEHTLLDASVADLAQSALQGDRADDLQQRQIGFYRLTRLLGEGGTGIVYLAERVHIGGLVAIKVLRHAWLSPMRRERFQVEQQTLARLNHPGIASIYDSSTLEDGTPWFAMEYVPGKPLTGWLNARSGSIRDDLLLFRKVCEPVRYAHSLGTVHRDLKPSNILVTAAGDVKLLDFGIAKQLDDNPETQRTVDDLRMMTPAYAAPEQRTGRAVGVFTDVYALGVLLYEIVAGTLPTGKNGAAYLPTDDLDAGPVAPSLYGKSGSSPGRQAGLVVRDWADLDLLCTTALQPQADRRYRTVDALLGDLDAWLGGYPLLARPHSRRDVLLRFARRHRAALLSAAAVLLAFVAALTVFTVRLQHSRAAALQEAARVRRIQRFTESLFDGGDREEGRAIDLKTSDLLRRGEVEAESLHDDPRMQADMFATLGTVYQRLGSLGKADALLMRALQQRRSSLGEQDPQYTESLQQVGLLRKDQRRLPEAESLFRDVVERRRAVHDDAGLQQALVRLASVLTVEGRYDTSHALLEESEALARKTRTENTAGYADILTEQGTVAFYLAKYDESRALNLRALALERSLYGNRHPKTAETLSTLGQIAKDQGEGVLSESLLRQSLTITSAWFGEDHPAVAANLTSLSHALVMEEKYDEAYGLLQHALTIEQHAYGARHPFVAEAWNEIGVLAYSRDRDDEAEAAFRHAHDIYAAMYGPNHQFVGVAFSNLVGVYMDRKDYVAAEQYARKALQVYAVSLPEDHPNPAAVHVKLGRILMRQQRYAEAAPESLKGFRYFSRHKGESSYMIGARKDLLEIAKHLDDAHLAESLRHEVELSAAGLP